MISPHPAVLLVEDNPDDECLALLAIRKDDPTIQVTLAHDGAEAMQYLLHDGAEKPRYDLVILDLKLPKMNGIDVLNGMRKHEAQHHQYPIPVVVMSSSDDDLDIQQCYDAGANSFLRKSTDYTQFMDDIAKLKNYWLRLNEAPLH